MPALLSFGDGLGLVILGCAAWGVVGIIVGVYVVASRPTAQRGLGILLGAVGAAVGAFVLGSIACMAAWEMAHNGALKVL